MLPHHSQKCCYYRSKYHNENKHLSSIALRCLLPYEVLPIQKPISSKISEIRIIATNVSVAFHTILVTSITSDHPTTPVRSATTAPTAVIEISNPWFAKLQKLM